MGSPLQHVAYSYHIHIQMLEFCRDTWQDLSNFEADGVGHVHHTQVAVANVLALANRHR